MKKFMVLVLIAVSVALLPSHALAVTKMKLA